jgi:ATP-dependent DNA helicase RecQ
VPDSVKRLQDRLQTAARRTFGWAELHPDQLRAMTELMAGHDVLAVLPTGSGKSAIYQVPALLLEGPTLVVSPLLALQRDQIEGLEETRAPDAVAVNSAESAAERREAWEEVASGAAEYLFLSPEQLAKDEVVEQLAGLGVGLFVVDEAHCVSAWGHDFRPDYLRLAPVIERLGHPPVVALTATAAGPVREDIVTRLGLRDAREVIGSFNRPELRLAVERETSDERKQSAVVTRVRALTADPASRRGLVYTASRKDAESYAHELSALGVRADYYHAGRRAADRESVYEAFHGDRLDVVVATSAFGMGIDKPDVRFVVHASAPESLDAYYQHIGRGGRDGEAADCVLFYRPEDLHLQTFLTASRAPEETIREVAMALAAADEPVRPAALDVGGSAAARTRALNLLQQAGAVATAEGGAVSYADPSVPVAAAVATAVDVAETHQRLIRSRIEMMRGYAETTRCRRQFLLGYFGETLPEPCGNCDTCESGSAYQADTGPDDGAFPVDAAVVHDEFGTGVVMSGDGETVTVLFDDVGYKTLARSVVEESGVLRLADGRGRMDA